MTMPGWALKGEGQQQMGQQQMGQPAFSGQGGEIQVDTSFTDTLEVNLGRAEQGGGGLGKTSSFKPSDAIKADHIITSRELELTAPIGVGAEGKVGMKVTQHQTV
jgi:hypothetical protein